MHLYPSEMAQTFWTAIVAFTTCLVVTTLVSLVTQPRPEAELRGLVWALTERPRERDVPVLQRPSTFAIIVLLMILALNVIFF